MNTEYYRLYFNGQEGKRLAEIQAKSGMKAFHSLYNFLVPIQPGTYWHYDLHYWLKNDVIGKYFIPKNVGRGMMNYSYEVYSYEVKFTFICFEDVIDAMAFKLRWST